VNECKPLVPPRTHTELSHTQYSPALQVARLKLRAPMSSHSPPTLRQHSNAPPASSTRLPPTGPHASLPAPKAAATTPGYDATSPRGSSAHHTQRFAFGVVAMAFLPEGIWLVNFPFSLTNAHQCTNPLCANRRAKLSQHSRHLERQQAEAFAGTSEDGRCFHSSTFHTNLRRSASLKPHKTTMVSHKRCLR